MFFLFARPPSENPPKGPLVIGAGPTPEATLNNTEMLVDVPSGRIDARVTFLFNETRQYFIYVMSPYTVLSKSAYAIYQNGLYPHEMPESKPIIGNFSTDSLNTANGSIVKATLDLNPDFTFVYEDTKNMKYELTLGVSITVSNPLVAIDYPWGTSQTVIMTFFGDESGIVSSEMYPFMQPRSLITVGYPFIVQMRLPESTYFSHSQPSPIEYYMKEGNRWVMFSIDFLQGRYAQTLVCTSMDPTMEAMKQIFIFAGGIFIALGSAFTVQTVRYISEKDDITTQKPQSDDTQQPSEVKKLVELVEEGYEKRYWVIRFKNPWFACFLVLTIVEILIVAYLLFLASMVVSNLPSNIVVTASIALIAALISFMSLSFTVLKAFEPERRYEEFITYNYRMLESKVNEIDRTVLKALIMVKSKQPEFDLRKIATEEILNRARLLDRLYE
jgi:hypothetical protein